MSHTTKITDLERENGILSSISLNLDTQRGFDEQFETIMEDGSIKARYSLPETAVDKLSDSVNSLKGQKAEVFSDGTKIGEGTFNQDTQIRSYRDDIYFGFDINEDLIQEGGIPDLEDLPSGIDSAEDFARAFDIRNLTFKLVKKAQDKVKNTSPSDAAEVDDTTPSDNNLWNPVNSTSPGGLNSPEGRAERRAEIRAERRDTPGDVLSDPPAAEAANKYKGIIQLGFVAVVIAGTVGAFVWGKN
jgi:hypothetical protein